MKKAVAVLATCFAVLASPAYAAVTFDFIFDNGAPTSVSNDGSVVAGNDNSFTSFRWTQATGLVSLGRPYTNGRIMEILPGTHDILSAFFEARTRVLQPGDVVNLECHADRRNYPLKTQVYRRERVSVPAGDFDCLVVEPMLRTPGLFEHEGSLTIWLTDDARKIPVQMKSKLPIGSISVVLTGIEGPGGGGGQP